MWSTWLPPVLTQSPTQPCGTCAWGAAVSAPRLSYSDTTMTLPDILWCTKNLTFSGPALTKRPVGGLKSGTMCCDIYQMRILGFGEAKRPVKATQLSQGKDLSSTFSPGLHPLAVSTHASRSQGHGAATAGGMGREHRQGGQGALIHGTFPNGPVP